MSETATLPKPAEKVPAKVEPKLPNIQPVVPISIDTMLDEGKGKGKRAPIVPKAETPVEPATPVVEVKTEPAKTEEPAKVETPAETPAAVVAEPAKDSPEFKTAFDEVSKKFFGEEAPSVESKPVVEDKKPDTSSIQKDYDFIMSDPELKELVAAKKAGKSVTSFLTELKGVDVDKMNGEDLVREDCKRLGINNPDEVAAEIDAYNNSTPRQRAQEENRIKGMLKTEQSERLAKFSANAVAESKVAVDATQKLDTELEQIYSERIGKEYFGLKITPEILEPVKNEIYQGLNIFNQDGTYNAKTMFQLAYLKAHHVKIAQEIGENMFHKGRGTTLEEVSRPNKNMTTAKPPVAVSDPNEGVSVGDQLIKEVRPRTTWNR